MATGGFVLIWVGFTFVFGIAQMIVSRRAVPDTRQQIAATDDSTRYSSLP